MHFTLSNLLYDFSNSKYMLFSLLKKIHVKNTGQLNLTYRPIDPNPFNPLKMTHFDPQPDCPNQANGGAALRPRGALAPPKFFKIFIYICTYMSYSEN